MKCDDQLPKIVAILGTNASGKSELAIRLARDFNGEIISADSRQVYQGLYLCSGKVRPSERQGIPHHLLDVVDVGVEFSLAHYQRLGYDAIDGVLARQHLPFVVGGTGLYLQSIIDGYTLVDAPPNQPLRTELEAKPLEELADILKTENPQTAALIELHNRRRIIRALEIHRSGFDYQTTRTRRPRYRTLMLGVTWSRDVLLDRIEQRLRRRVREGMVNEVRDLLDAGVSQKTVDDLGLEFRHVLRFLQGEYRTEEELIEKLKIAIRQFARRQVAWFKRDSRIVWLDTATDYYGEAQSRIREWIDRD